VSHSKMPFWSDLKDKWNRFEDSVQEAWDHRAPVEAVFGFQDPWLIGDYISGKQSVDEKLMDDVDYWMRVGGDILNTRADYSGSYRTRKRMRDLNRSLLENQDDFPGSQPEPKRPKPEGPPEDGPDDEPDDSDDEDPSDFASAHHNPNFIMGKYSGLFKPTKKVNVNEYAKYGSVKVLEQGGVVASVGGASDTNSVYIGHSTFWRDEVLLSVGRAVCKLIARLLKYEVRSFSDVLPFVVSSGKSFRITSFPTMISTAVNSGFVIIPVGTTWNELANSIVVTMGNLMTVASDPIVFDRLELFDVSSSAELVINLRSVTVQMNCKSKMTIQNQTTAATSSTDAENIDHVESNPINGRRYQASSNGLFQRKQLDNTGSARLFVGNSDGVKAFVPDTLEKEIYGKPPSGTQFSNCRRDAHIRLDPGDLKSSFISTYYKVGFNKLFKDLGRHLFDFARASNEKVYPVKYHKCEFYGFEKQLNTRVTEPPVKIGYEHVYWINCSVYYRDNQVTTRLVDIR
jgi:hypothetical protein